MSKIKSNDIKIPLLRVIAHQKTVLYFLYEYVFVGSLVEDPTRLWAGRNTLCLYTQGPLRETTAGTNGNNKAYLSYNGLLLSRGELFTGKTNLPNTCGVDMDNLLLIKAG